eukprot:1158027-Pelagomonas_calceolata.AAC.6
MSLHAACGTDLSAQRCACVLASMVQAFICEAARSSAPPASKAPPKQPAPNSLPYIARRARRQRRLQQREQGQEANPGAAGGAWGQHDAQEDAPSNSLLHSQQDQPSSAAPLPPGQAPGATKNGRTHRRASAEAASCKLTTDISRAHSLNELSGLLDKHGDSMNIVNITAFLSRCVHEGVPGVFAREYQVRA